MQNLDDVASKYLQPPTVEIENDLILNWYPKRVAESTGHVGRLLELGLGHGYTLPYFAKMCDEHVVIEGSSKVIEYFRSQNPGYKGTIVEGYFEDYTPDAPFDLIVMGFILEHVADPFLILKRYREFLNPGGKVVVAVPNAKSLNRRIGLELGKIDDIYELNSNDLALGHQRQYCIETLREQVESAGYKISLVEGIYLKPLPLPILQLLPDFEENLQAMMRVGINFPELCVGLLMELEA